MAAKKLAITMALILCCSTAAQAGPLRNLLKGRGGGGGGDASDCADGSCGDPAMQGGLDPSFTPLTPLASLPAASQPFVQTTRPAATVAPSATIAATAPAATVAVAAPAGDAAALASMSQSLADLATRLGALQTKAAPTTPPQPQRLPGSVEDDRVAVLEGMMRQIAKKLDVDVEPVEGDGGRLLDTLPDVELSLVYPDGAVRSTKIDLRSRVLKEFGADVPEEK